MMTAEQIVDYARSLAGLTADPSGCGYKAYLDLIAPGETPERAADMAKVSDCALVVAGVWRAAGVDHPSLHAPYVTGTAGTRLYELARLSGAICQPYQNTRPNPGDCVWVGHGGAEHFYTCVSVDGDLVMGIDGGQRDEHGFETILLKEHHWLALNEQARVPNGTWGGARSINGWFSLASILGVFGATEGAT